MGKIKASFCLFVSFIGKCQQSRLTQVQIKCFFSQQGLNPNILIVCCYILLQDPISPLAKA